MNDKRARLLRLFNPEKPEDLRWLCGQLDIDLRQARLWLQAAGHDV